MPQTELRPPTVILNAPQLAENIGAVARAMANFGLHDLRLVRPRDGWPQDRAWASASGADWPLDNAQVHDRIEDAIAGLQLVFATTARPRELNLPILTPREAAADWARFSERNLGSMGTVTTAWQSAMSFVSSPARSAP